MNIPGIRIDHGIVSEAGYVSYWQSIQIPSWFLAAWLVLAAIALIWVMIAKEEK